MRSKSLARPARSCPVRSRLACGTAAALATLGCSLVGASSASAEEAIYSATRTVAVPPASNFKTGGGGGDGWAVALSDTVVYNIYHHSSKLTVACHEQANGAECFSPETITDGEGHNFATSGHPAMYLDHNAGKLYVYASRLSDKTAGVVCIDTNKATEEPNPFCGYTPLTPAGQGPLLEESEPEWAISGTSTPALVGTHWYAFNQVPGTNISGAENELLCFDVSTDTACSGQPFAVPFGEGSVTEIYPGPASAVLGGKVLIPLNIEGKTRIACFDGATEQTCAGSWPLSLEGVEYAGRHGSPFALLDKHGKLSGFCIPTGTDQCFTLRGEPSETPAAMPSVIAGNDEWNGPGLTIGPRVYVPNGEANGYSGEVQCFDYATGAGCSNFPKTFSKLSYLYTVNADPQRPTCLWVNADGGEDQIQDFDAYTGEACGTGPIRGLGAQFVAPGEQCTPISYVGLHVLRPATSAYTSAAITFTDGDGEPIAGLEELALDSSGNLSLETLNLNSESGLPQFLFKFSGLVEETTSIEVSLTWRASYAESCAGEGRSVRRLGTAPDPKPKQPPAASPVVSTPPPPLPQCSAEQIALTNVVERGSKVWIEGHARTHLTGRKVSIELTATGRTVATAIVAPNGTFSASAPMPPGGMRHSNRTRYRAFLGSLRSLPLKLYRRMYITSASATNGGVLLKGRVTGPFRPGAPVAVYLSQTCSGQRLVGRSKLTRAGTFSLVVAAPSGPAGQLDLYRAGTEVLYHRHLEPTWTLPTAFAN